ncbi:MAG: hypothetical protein EBQ96_06940 [Proteobacteria bacterium]|nr:hypothetical protein [Pseudomonadota bacterium]
MRSVSRIPLHPFFSGVSSNAGGLNPLIATTISPDRDKMAAARAAHAFIEEAAWRYEVHLAQLAAFGRSLPLARPDITAGYKWHVEISPLKRKLIGWGAVMPFMDAVEVAAVHDGMIGHNANLLEGEPKPLETVRFAVATHDTGPQTLKIAA